MSLELYAEKLRNYGIDFSMKLRKYLKLRNNSVKYIQMFEFNCDLLNTISCYMPMEGYPDVQ